MKGEVAEQLRPLVQRFAVEKVRDALVPLIAGWNFSDWQCVASAVTRIARQQKRNARGIRATDAAPITSYAAGFARELRLCIADCVIALPLPIAGNEYP